MCAHSADEINEEEYLHFIKRKKQTKKPSNVVVLSVLDLVC